jgi:glyoxylase-like metal-dependent hydrolase (beta-lactamase superfamily II)
VLELAAGLWHWDAPHPDWTSEQRWPQRVSSYAIDDGTRLLLFDPLAVPDEIGQLAADREPVIVLTAPWHERDAKSLVEQLGAPVFTPPPDTGEDLMQKFDVTAEQLQGWVSDDVRWLMEGDGLEKHLYAAGERLPFGAEVFQGREHNDLVLWLEDRRALVAGDSLADFGDGLEIQVDKMGGRVTREEVAERLRPLLAEPVEYVLAAHGGPMVRAALERALA